MTFDFNKLKRETFDIIFPTESEISLHVLRPLKNQLEELITVSDVFDEISKNKKATPEQQKTLIETSAMVLSRNIEGKTYTPEDIERKFDVDDLFYLLDGYLSFVFSLSDRKN